MDKIKSVLIIISIIILGPVGMLFMWFWRREWLQKRSVAVVTAAWSILYIIAMFNPSPVEELMTTVSANETIKPPEEKYPSISVPAENENESELTDKTKDEQPDLTNQEGVNTPAPVTVEDAPQSTYTPAPATSPIPDTSSMSTEENKSANTTYENTSGECIIKGNVNKDGEKIYHTPASRSYKITKINPDEGDRWFCTGEEAESAGFRAAED